MSSSLSLVAVGRRRPTEAVPRPPLVAGCARNRRGRVPLFSQCLCATNCEKVSEVGYFMLQRNRDGAVCAGLGGRVVPGSSSGEMVGAADDPTWGNTGPMSK